MNSVTVPAKLDSLDAVIQFVFSQMEQCCCPESTLLEIQLAVEEIFVNIASYAYSPGEGEAEVHCQVLEEPSRVVIRFLDSGKPFDPLAREEPDTSEEGLLEREGGLGILLVCHTMDSVSYSYANGRNILTMTKLL